MSGDAYCSRGSVDGLVAEFDRPLADCPLCASPAIERYDHDHTGCRVDRCQECRLMFMNPQYTDRYLDQYYSQYGQCGDEALKIPSPDDLSNRRVAAKRDAFHLLGRHAQPGRFLSIGCYDGIELLLADRHGWEPEGYDVDAGTIALLGKQVHYPLYSGDFFQLRLPAHHYDCVLMDQVLEHPKNPRDYLLEVHRILRPGGLLYIGCPNIKSISNQFKTVLGKLHLKRRRGKHYDMFHHLFFYDPWTLKRILESHYGFDVVLIQGDPVIGLKTMTLTDDWRTRSSNSLRRRFPFLESSFRLLARKPEKVLASSSRQAA
jgi:SAM-dependent methyltransferase